MTDVSEVPDDCPVLVGQVPLDLLDFVVDPAGQRLIGNPEHGGEHVLKYTDASEWRGVGTTRRAFVGAGHT